MYLLHETIETKPTVLRNFTYDDIFIRLQPPAFAGQTPGVLDCVEGDSVRGWAWNSPDPASAVEVKVTVTNQATGQTEAEYTAPADDYRRPGKERHRNRQLRF